MFAKKKWVSAGECLQYLMMFKILYSQILLVFFNIRKEQIK